jgi:hypothetical protein
LMSQLVSRSLLAVTGGSADTTTSSSSGSKVARSSARLGGPRHCGVAGNQPGQRAVAGETAAAAAVVGIARSNAQQGQPRPLVVFDIDETLLSNMPQILDPAAWTWEAWVAAAQAEPLQPMAAFYAALCRWAGPAGGARGNRRQARVHQASSLLHGLCRFGLARPHRLSCMGCSCLGDSACRRQLCAAGTSHCSRVCLPLVHDWCC